jgi:hypothetical protein
VNRRSRDDAERYGVVLGLLLATFIMLSAAPTGRWAVALSTALQAATLVAAFHAARTRRPLLAIAVVVGLVSVAVAVAAAIGGTAEERDGVYIVDLLLVAVAPAAIIVGIIRRGRLDIQTVLGALCVYVLIGMFWAFVYASVDAIGTGSFFAQTAKATTSDYLYFSFVTLTTTGYGDLTAAGQLGRAFAVIEALLGQLYLVTVVALLVSNLSPRRKLS